MTSEALGRKVLARRSDTKPAKARTQTANEALGRNELARRSGKGLSWVRRSDAKGYYS